MIMQDFDHFNGSQLGAHLDNVAQEMGFEWEDGYKFARVSNKTLGLPEGGDDDQTNRYVVTNLTVAHHAEPRYPLEHRVPHPSHPTDFGRITTFTLGGDAPSLEVKHETLLGHGVGDQRVRDRSELTPTNLRALKRTQSSVIPTGWSVGSVEPNSYIDSMRDQEREGKNIRDPDYTPLIDKRYAESAAYEWLEDTSRTGSVYEQKMPHPKTLDSIQKTGEDLRVSHREEDPDNIDFHVGRGELWLAMQVDNHSNIVRAASEGMSTKPRVAPGQVQVLSARGSQSAWPTLPEMVVPDANVTEDGRTIYSNFSFNNLSQQFERMPD